MPDHSDPSSLIILEPSLSEDSSLPILARPDEADDIPRPSRDRRIKLADGLRWMLGDDAVGFVTQCELGRGLLASSSARSWEPGQPTHFLRFGRGSIALRRRPCSRDQWSHVLPEDGMAIETGTRWEFA